MVFSVWQGIDLKFTTEVKSILICIGVLKNMSLIASRMMVGENDYYVDLLFYHRELQCLVAIDLKIDDFKPEYTGKMDFYLEALDRDVKKSHENPSVGMILCKNADTDVVEYSLSRSLSQTMIAEYKTKLIDKAILKQKLAELYNDAEEEIKTLRSDESFNNSD